MALTVYGDNTAPLILHSDIGKPKPRTLRIKFLSKREIRAWQKKAAAARDLDDIDARDAAYDACLAEVVVGWENLTGEFSIAALADNYTLPEFMALLDLIPMAMVPGADDAKKSASDAK